MGTLMFHAQILDEEDGKIEFVDNGLLSSMDWTIMITLSPTLRLWIILRR